MRTARRRTPIVAYAAKYASAFYGPFREAAESAPAFGDRRSYQMDPANAREALREVLLDVEEGADLVMVKPAGPYLDVIRQVRDAVRVPVVAYQVSGEFSLIKAAAARGWIDERAAVLETLTGIRRAGADLIISYFAPRGGAVAARMSVPVETRCHRRPAAPFSPPAGASRAAHRPIWIMRQAGRYLPEYRALRAKVDFEALTRTPELAAEVTLQPLRRFELDAAILFSDIMTPLQGMGVELKFEPGPVVREPIRTDAQIDALPRAGAGARRAVRARDDPPGARRRCRAACRSSASPAPRSRSCATSSAASPPRNSPPRARSCTRSPQSAQRLLAHLADAMAEYLSAQAAAGAQALMLFESWAGLLAPPQFTHFALAAVRRTAAALRRTGVPLIYYVNQGSALMPAVADLDVDVIGVDWRIAARAGAPDPGARQGGAGQPRSGGAVCHARRSCGVTWTRCIEQAGPAPGHIFNLGHGIWPDTDPDAVARLVDYVHERR